MTERTAALVDRIAEHGLLTALEFHPATLTETAASATELLDALDRPGTPHALATRSGALARRSARRARRS